MSADVQNELILLRELVAALRVENTLLRQKIDLLVRRVFGSSSEQIDPAQLELLLQLAAAPAVVEGKTVPEKNKVCAGLRRARVPRLPDNLPVIEEVIDPEPVKAAPESWRCIGQEVSEQLDYEPAHFLRRRTVRRKYVHRQDTDRAPVIAPLPERLQERGLAAPGLLAQVIVSKYCDHLPLYRQEQIYARRHGVHLPRQTLARWMGLAADWLRPIYQQIRTGVMAGGYIQVDETPIEYLEPGHGQTRQGYLWTCARPGGDVVFQWETSRAAECLNKFIAVDFSGTVQCDGYSAYAAFAQKRGDKIELAGCWAHVRRKFYEALEQSPRGAGWIVRQIQHLYQSEARLRQRRAGPSLREAVRTNESRPVIERLHRALVGWKMTRRFLPQSSLGNAIDYTLSQWPMLTVFVEDGRIEIDNNLVENAIRPTAIGKKNWLFVGEADAGERGAILYTIVESCRRRGIDPYAYLRDVLTRLPQMTNWQIKEVTPEAWAKAQKSLLLKAAS
ncbi:MAG: IS66 family transposase [Acidobacteriales bacterium]|nr:IS66 family transposase [Terriglobales bacterium]